MTALDLCESQFSAVGFCAPAALNAYHPYARFGQAPTRTPISRGDSDGTQTHADAPINEGHNSAASLDVHGVQSWGIACDHIIGVPSACHRSHLDDPEAYAEDEEHRHHRHAGGAELVSPALRILVCAVEESRIPTTDPT